MYVVLEYCAQGLKPLLCQRESETPTTPETRCRRFSQRSTGFGFLRLGIGRPPPPLGRLPPTSLPGEDAPMDFPGQYSNVDCRGLGSRFKNIMGSSVFFACGRTSLEITPSQSCHPILQPSGIFFWNVTSNFQECWILLCGCGCWGQIFFPLAPVFTRLWCFIAGDKDIYTPKKLDSSPGIN